MTETSFAVVSIADGAVHVLPADAFTERQRNAIAHIIQQRGKDPMPGGGGQAAEAHPATPSDTIRQRTLAVASARAQGFSGDLCDRCGSAQMRRSGTCLTCQSCGSTTGCS